MNTNKRKDVKINILTRTVTRKTRQIHDIHGLLAANCETGKEGHVSGVTDRNTKIH